MIRCSIQELGLLGKENPVRSLPSAGPLLSYPGLLRRHQLLKIWNAMMAGEATVIQGKMPYWWLVTALKTVLRPASPMSTSLHSCWVPVGISYSVCSLNSKSYPKNLPSFCTLHFNTTRGIICIPPRPPHLSGFPTIWSLILFGINFNKCESEGTRHSHLCPIVMGACSCD